jgi:AcrR family transcriptional regulator
MSASSSAPSSDGTKKPLRPTLREDSRQRTRDRIINGALVAIAESGLDATVDQIAAAAGVSRRTVFRQFSNHAELLLAALDEIRRLFEAEMPVAPSPGADVQAWLVESTVSIHELFRRAIGRAFWDLHGERPRVSDSVAERIAEVPAFRERLAGELTVAAWGALGGNGAPPQWVIDTFAIHISGFSAFAHPEQSARETGELSARVLWLVLLDALSEERRAVIH